MKPAPGVLWLVPTLLADSDPESVLPAATLAVARRTRYFLVENAKSARSYLQRIGHPGPIASLRIVTMEADPSADQIDDWLRPLAADGLDAAVLAEAGCPGIADPGALLARRAHELNVPVRALVGPSSILLALMASGMNGQAFRFVGYLPRAAAERDAALRELERVSALRGETQIAIETPYRNQALFAALLTVCAPTTRLHLSVALTSDHAQALTRTVAQWRLATPPAFFRQPCVFALLASAVRPPSSGAPGPTTKHPRKSAPARA